MKNLKSTPGIRNDRLYVLFTGLVYREVLTGGDQLFIDIAPRLPKDIKVVVVMPHFAAKHWKNIDQTNIEFRLLPSNMFEFKSNPLMIFFSYVVRAFQTYRILKKENARIIYSNSDIAYADIWPAYCLARKNPGVKWITRIYHVLLPPKNRQGNFLVNIVAFRLQRLSFWMMKKHSSVIFALNPKLRLELLELGFPKDRLDVLGAGIDFQKINTFKPKREYAYDVVVLGRIAPVKGIFDAVKIWGKVHAAKPDATLAWIGGGGGNHRKKMVQQLEERGLVDSFRLLGFMDKEDVYSVLKSAKVFLCPDHENGWGLAVCEAMSSGLPVVSYDLDIFGGVYKKGFKSVRLFDTDSFADEVIILLNNESKRKKLAMDASAQAKEFDHQAIVDTLVKVLY